MKIFMTTEEFIEKVKKNNRHNLKVKGEFIDLQTPILTECLDHQIEWSPPAKRLLDGCGCRICRTVCSPDRKEKLIEAFKRRLVNKHKNIILTGGFINTETEADFHCNTCNYDWKDIPEYVMSRRMCPNCSEIQKEQDRQAREKEFVEYIEQQKKGYKVVGKYINNFTPIDILCPNGHIWAPVPRNVKSHDSECVYCVGKAVWVGDNDLWTTHPEVAKLLTNPEDGYRYSFGSSKRVSWTCPDCGDISEKTIYQVVWAGFSCQKCSDGISYPNKFGRALLDQLPISNHICEYTPDWAKPYIYDNYFEYNGKRYILEVDGAFHYMEHTHSAQSLEDRQATDRIKTELAAQNSISVIRIDCRKSDGEYIKSNILLSDLNGIFDLSHIDWIMCEQKAQKNLVKVASELYASGITDLKIIMEQLHIGISSALEYVKIGTKLGWCNYSYENGRRNRVEKLQRAIVIIDDYGNVLHHFPGIHPCLKDIERIYNTVINASCVIKSCKLHTLYKGINFRYADEYNTK